jgi:hypothetical protein
MIWLRLQLAGRKFSDTKSSIRLAQSRLPRWMMALIIASLPRHGKARPRSPEF